MQEIEVPPRDVFQHYVHVDQADKTLVWWFSTKKKNISFGLFFRRSSPPILKSNTLAPSITSASPPSRTESVHSRSNISHSQGGSSGGQYSKEGILSSSPTKSSHASNYASTIDSSDDEDQTSELGDGASIDQQNTNQSSRPSNRKKKTVAKFKDPDLIEILPIQHYSSGSVTIRGEHVVKEAGSYVLVFDNSFSINTSKRLTFFVALEERGRKISTQPSSEMSGWLLKKKRKRMQGWAKRWFRIDNGILSYYKDPESPCRGKVHLVLSTVTVSQASNMIHIDSGTMLYHLKALTVDEYNAWTAAIKVVKKEDKAAHDTVHRMTQRESSQKRANLRNSWIGSNDELDNLKNIMSAMDAGFLDIKEQLESIRAQTEAVPSNGSATKSASRERQTSIDNNNNNNNSNNPKFKLGKFAIPSLQRTTSDGSIASSQTSIDSIHSKLQVSFAKLKTDKDNAFEIMRSEIEKWEKNEKQFRLLLSENQNLSSTRTTENSALSHALEDFAIRKSMNSERTHSFTSSIHTGSDIFYDADDAVLTTDLSPGELSDLEGVGFDDQANDDNSSDDDAPAEEPAKEEPAPTPQPVAEGAAVEEPIVRRTVLPAPVSGEDISLLSILRKNVGKDLSTVAMPVSLNEPINVLQRLCEELEYSELLDKAASLPDSLDRMVYVAAFAVSGYSTTQWRAARKPFNPLHGETYEFISPEKGFKFISEKVSHYPPVMACHAESIHDWSMSMDSRAKTKFWGKSMELMPNGTVHINLHKSGDHYTIHKPSTWMRNLMAGTKYLEHTGELKVVNHTTRETCVLTFKESSYFAGTKNEVVGHVTDASGTKKRSLQGRWSESMMEEVGPNKFERLWKVNTPPANHGKYYGFTEFTMHLNEMTKGLEAKLPKTDSRFRPDQSLFEHGKVEEADKEKLRIEQRQRDLRKAMEAKGEQWNVRWFEKKTDPQTEDPEGQTWRYKGGYWETRETGEWNEKPKNAHGGGIRDRNHFGNYARLAPASLKLGVTPPDVDSLIPTHISRPSYALRGEPSEWASNIPINSPESIEKCRRAGQLAKKILELGGSLVKQGVNTSEIDRILHEAIIANNAYPSPLNYMGFPKSVCTSVSNVIAHGIPDNRDLEDGDIINIDITVYLDGYHGDTSATFLVGNVDRPGRELVERTRESLDAAIAICGPGVPFNKIGKTIQSIADRHGYSVSEQFSGHGIGKEFHCLPLIYHHDNDEEGDMEKGMIFTIEPMFCQGTAVGVQWPDKWTVSTADGGRSAQFEHTILITENGAERLTG
ncbi:Oxysterol-binding protein- protein 3 [Mortierella sp. AM989]|nr:Oxysterol-binding protein- protein 3 [Mortierella sp. AM989]